MEPVDRRKKPIGFRWNLSRSVEFFEGRSLRRRMSSSVSRLATVVGASGCDKTSARVGKDDRQAIGSLQSNPGYYADTGFRNGCSSQRSESSSRDERNASSQRSDILFRCREFFSRADRSICSARILNPPEIRYRNRQGQGEAVEHVSFGKWTIANQFYTTPDISTWGMIYIGCPPNEAITGILNEFAKQLPIVRKRLCFSSPEGFLLVPWTEGIHLPIGTSEKTRSRSASRHRKRSTRGQSETLATGHGYFEYQ